MERTNLSGTNLRTAFVLLLVLATFVLFLAVLWPFLTPLLFGAILASLCQPLYQAVTRLLGGRASLGAFVTLFILFLLVVGPLSAFIGVVVGQAVHVSNDAIPWVQEHLGGAAAFNAHDWLVARFPSLAPYVPDQAQIMENVGNAAKAAGAFLVAGASSITAGTAIFLLDLFVMLYAMFFSCATARKSWRRFFITRPSITRRKRASCNASLPSRAPRSRARLSSVSFKGRSPDLVFGPRASRAQLSGER